MKKSFALIIVIISLSFSCQKEQSKLVTDSEKMFYSMGHQYGENLKKLAPSEVSLEIFIRGLRDSAANIKAVDNTNKYAHQASKLLEQYRTENAKDEKVVAKKFISELMTNDSEYIKTESGLIYKIVTAGEKKRATLKDFVKVSYQGKHLNGEVFEKTTPETTPTLPLKGLIPAWKEALQKIGIGGEIIIIAPSHLAYGDAGAPPRIAGGEAVIFEMKLLGIERRK